MPTLPRKAVWLGGAFAVLVAAFQWRNHEMVRLAGGQEVKPLDGELTGYTPEQVAELFDKLGEAGRSFYAVSQVSLDFVFPLIYAALVITLAWACLNGAWRALLTAIGVLAALADLFENALIAYLACTFASETQPLASLASTATQSKWALLAVLVVVFALGMLHKRVTGRAEESSGPT